MTVKYYNLSEEEKALLFAVEDAFPEYCTTFEITDSLDGETVLELVIKPLYENPEIIAAVIQATGAIVAAIITANAKKKDETEKKDTPDKKKAAVVAVDVGGEEKSVKTEEDLKELEKKMKKAEPATKNEALRK